MCASQGDQGLALQRERPADLVITDIFMPEKEGIETIHQLTQEYPGIKVIAMSGGGKSPRMLENLSVTAGALGIAAFLRKPFEVRTLCESVRQVLE